ncbi:hypothetical protein ACFV4I_01115 [Nocardiopsis alba]|uniref:DUF4126 domain-containing protein n=2 Tax=Nocardiopsis alba TaxID=53437 RepID=A0A7K2J093_9ACTN|nr:hypothetical protein [Nocardiopsis alba]AFR06665.1 hypothetical protein B005_5119 [Nocardiopsis alba ATCC BAA-2165]MYR35680.1 hypothetical protein [Nocardiopsis alba]
MRTPLLRALALGLAAGARGTLGPCAPLWARARDEGRVGGRCLAALTVAGEMLGDKTPAVPARTEGPGLLFRAFSGAWGGTLLARRTGASVPLTAGICALTAPVGATLGVGWRSWWGERRPDWQGALMEDAVALSLARYAVRRS